MSIDTRKPERTREETGADVVALIDGQRVGDPGDRSRYRAFPW
jgi:hypothetical protein